MPSQNLEASSVVAIGSQAEPPTSPTRREGAVGQSGGGGGGGGPGGAEFQRVGSRGAAVGTAVGAAAAAAGDASSRALSPRADRSGAPRADWRGDRGDAGCLGEAEAGEGGLCNGLAGAAWRAAFAFFVPPLLRGSLPLLELLRRPLAPVAPAAARGLTAAAAAAAALAPPRSARLGGGREGAWSETAVRREALDDDAGERATGVPAEPVADDGLDPPLAAPCTPPSAPRALPRSGAASFARGGSVLLLLFLGARFGAGAAGDAASRPPASAALGRRGAGPPSGATATSSGGKADTTAPLGEGGAAWAAGLSCIHCSGFCSALARAIATSPARLRRLASASPPCGFAALARSFAARGHMGIADVVVSSGRIGGSLITSAGAARRATAFPICPEQKAPLVVRPVRG